VNCCPAVTEELDKDVDRMAPWAELPAAARQNSMVQAERYILEKGMAGFPYSRYSLDTREQP
jgi:hypothetical protein